MRNLLLLLALVTFGCQQKSNRKDEIRVDVTLLNWELNKVEDTLIKIEQKVYFFDSLSGATNSIVTSDSTEKYLKQATRLEWRIDSFKRAIKFTEDQLKYE